jgi:hypothetical protein
LKRTAILAGITAIVGAAGTILEAGNLPNLADLSKIAADGLGAASAAALAYIGMKLGHNSKGEFLKAEPKE